MSNIRSSEMSSNCVNIVDGFCHFWKYPDRLGFFYTVDATMEGKYYDHIIIKSEPFWVFKAVDFYCKNCPAYQRRSE
jgi:hypothetical protein